MPKLLFESASNKPVHFYLFSIILQIKILYVAIDKSMSVSVYIHADPQASGVIEHHFLLSNASSFLENYHFFQQAL
ncbi:MAG: hypothetical protein ACJAS1_003888 [Oleiphilaceae bacterium]|jgi:hypothetical protein